MVRSSFLTWDELDSLITVAGEPHLYSSLGCTSTVVSCGQWYDNAMLVPHEPMRYLLLLLERAVQPSFLQPHRAWKVRRIAHYYRAVLFPFIHHHHEAEETVFFPWVISKPNVTLPVQLYDEHVTLLAYLDRIDHMLVKGYAAVELSTKEVLLAWAVQLREEVQGMTALVMHHLEEEETAVCPALREHFTAEEETEIKHKLAIQTPRDAAPLMVAACCTGQLRAGGEAAHEQLIADMGPAGALYKREWKGQLEAEVESLDECTKDQDDEPQLVLGKLQLQELLITLVKH